MLSLIKKLMVHGRNLESRREVHCAPVANIQGYVDERSVRHVAGWLRNPDEFTERIAFDVAVVLPEETRILARGQADLPDPVLQKLDVGDGMYGFRVDFPTPLTGRERDHLVVRPAGSDIPLQMAPQFQGYVDERSIHHVAGWIRDRSDPTERVAFEVVLVAPDKLRVLGNGEAAEYSPVLAQQSIGDAAYGFQVIFSEPVTEQERDQIEVRVCATQAPLELAPELRTEFQPISHVAMDIVNNCNLRCPFCVYDYSNTRNTKLMTEATFDAALRLIPYVTDGNFWLSCEHEATMHPELTRFIERVPPVWRHKVMYTTNLARRMPDSYFDTLADSGMHHLNVSLESVDPDLYERMRKGARWGIFKHNWDQLISTFRAGSAPPRVRYNIMAYRSNLTEIPQLIKYLRHERLAWQVEVRHTFDVKHIPESFRATEFLERADWLWLEQELREYTSDEVLLIPPPEPDVVAKQRSEDQQSGSPQFVTRPLNLRLRYDGQLIVYGEWTGLTGMREHEQFVVTNIHHLRDPRQFVVAL